MPRCMKDLLGWTGLTVEPEMEPVRMVRACRLGNDSIH